MPKTGGWSGSRGRADRDRGFDNTGGSDRSKSPGAMAEREGGSSTRQAMASALGGAIGSMAGPVGSVVGSSIGGYAGGMRPGQAFGQGVGSLLGAPLGPLGMMAGGMLGRWAGSNMPQGAQGQPGRMMANRGGNGGNQILPYPRRQGMIGALV